MGVNLGKLQQSKQLLSSKFFFFLLTSDPRFAPDHLSAVMLVSARVAVPAEQNGAEPSIIDISPGDPCMSSIP